MFQVILKYIIDIYFFDTSQRANTAKQHNFHYLTEENFIYAGGFSESLTNSDTR